jgi:hypothetical protein
MPVPALIGLSKPPAKPVVLIDFAKRKGRFAKSFENKDLLRKVIGALIVLFCWENELQSDIITLTHL